MAWIDVYAKPMACLIITLFSIISPCDGMCRDLKIDTIVEGKVLVNHSISTIQPIKDRDTCASLCYLELQCFTFNFCKSNSSGSLCELLDSDHLRHVEDLVEKTDCTYYGSKTSCSSDPCFNNATCQGDFSMQDKPYLCVCTSGFTGQNCENDINECETKYHGCHVNATCNNIIGGYECYCKEGFHGNGTACQDINECESGDHGCHVNATCNNTIGGYECHCKEGLLGDGKLCQGPSSCEELKQFLPKNATTGFYEQELENGDMAKVFCSYESYSGCGEGPWTLVMKIDGSKNNFGYDSSHWNNPSVFNPDGSDGGLDEEETVSPAYWSTPLTKLCLGMKYNNNLKWILIDVNASSLYDIMANETEIRTQLREDKWRSLLTETSLQHKCNIEGFNLKCESKTYNNRKLRLGFFADDGNDACSSCDSFLGLGSVMDGHTDIPVCGNYARYGGDDGDSNIAAFCYILIQ